MNSDSLDIVILGLSFSSSWGNGHATTYRSLVKGLCEEGHQVTFLERDIEWYASNRDMETSEYCDLYFYKDLDDLEIYLDIIRRADLVMVGSYLKSGVEVSEFVLNQARGATAFYDIDTPVTISKLRKKDYEYIHPRLIPKFDFYFSFSGGDVLATLEQEFNASSAKPLYCSVDTDLYYPEYRNKEWQLGYLGTYSDDRQLTLEKLLLKTAKAKRENQFVVAGPQYPDDISWPENVRRINHLPPKDHRTFYNQQLFTLNVTRSAMIETGFSPSVRLFEAAACGTPVISDSWEGLGEFFEPGREILIAESTEDVEWYLNYSKEEIEQIANRARDRILQRHTSQARARELVSYVRNF